MVGYGSGATRSREVGRGDGGRVGVEESEELKSRGDKVETKEVML